MDIITKIRNQIANHLYKDGLTSTLKKNIVLSILFKVLSVAISFLLIPVIIDFTDTSTFGIWLTLSSIIIWISILDIGLTNGLRNKLVKVLSLKKYKLAKIYISTTYITLFAIFTSIWIIFLFANQYINWVDLLNLDKEYSATIRKVTIVVFSYFYLFFLLKIVNTILLADQKAAYASLIDLLSQIFTLGVIFVMTKTLSGSLLHLTLGMCITPVVVAFIFNLVLYYTRYKHLIPSPAYFRKWCIKDLANLGIKFFVIQIAVIIQYQTANVIIARLFDMEEVTNYNIAFKYFSILSIFFAITLHPLWSASTEAYNNNDYDWIKSITRKYIKLFFMLVIAGLFMLFISTFVYNIWIGKDIVSIPFALSLWCYIYVVTSMFGNIFVNTLNGIGAIRIQFICSIFTPILYIVLCLLFIKYMQMGIYAVFIASVLSNINGFIIAPIQYRKIFFQNKKGIWVA